MNPTPNPLSPIIGAVVSIIALIAQGLGYAFTSGQAAQLTLIITTAITLGGLVYSFYKGLGLKTAMSAMSARIALFERQQPPPMGRR